jgi:transcriptional regulator GlxA family with amidase domain
MAMTRRRQLVFTVLAFLLVPSLAGFAKLMMRDDNRSPPANIGEGIAVPAPRPPTTALPLAVVLVGNHGTEITDTLPPIEMLAASGAFEVRVVAPSRDVSAFHYVGLDFVPDLGFADYKRLVGRAPDVIVVPYILRWKETDAAVVQWLRDNTGPSTTVVSICAGAEIVAAAGLFDGHQATANDANLDGLIKQHPDVHWHRDVRWVHDRRRFSSGTLAAGIDATLATIKALAGEEAAMRAISTTHYKHARFLVDPRAKYADKGAGVYLEAAYRWESVTVGIAIRDGVSESAIAGMLEAYTATLNSEPLAIAGRREIIRSRHGLALVPRATTAANFDHLITLDNADHRFGYDVALEQVERTHGGPRARLAGALMNYPTHHLTVSGGAPVGLSMVLRALLLGLLAALFVRAAGNAFASYSSAVRDGV